MDSLFRGNDHKPVHRLVVKIGSSLITRDGGHLDAARINRFVQELAAIHRKGIQVVIVTSGAIAAGVGELGWGRRPFELPKKQAAAAVGQVRLMESYRQAFRKRGISVGQVLLTREDFENLKRRKNAQATLLTLLAERVIPIINENDTVAVEEIRVGDNDTLAARVAVKVKADLLVLLTDVEGLMTRHPKEGKGELIPLVEHIGPQIEAMAQGAGTDRGTGGMMTKIQAARYATRHGVAMLIASGLQRDVLQAAASGQSVGTLFTARL